MKDVLSQFHSLTDRPTTVQRSDQLPTSVQQVQRSTDSGQDNVQAAATNYQTASAVVHPSTHM